MLSNPLPENRQKEKIGLVLSLHQTEFAKPSIDADQIEKVIANPSVKIDSSSQAKNRKQGKFYVFPELSACMDFASFMVCVQVSDLAIKSSLSLNIISESLDKKQWENFWQLFNLVQSSCHFISLPKQAEATQSSQTVKDDKYTCLQYHDKELHEIVKQLIDNNIEFNREGGFYIDHEGSYAEAMLGFTTKKLFIRALSDDDRKLFELAGYKELDPTNFNINDII